MSHTTFSIQGKIRRRDNNQGVHGLSVEAWDDDRRCDDCLGQDLTNKNGSYCITFTEAAFKEPGEGEPEIYLKIRDCEGRLIHDTRGDRQICHPEQTEIINVTLVPDVLYWHLQVASWEYDGSPLVPRMIWEDIQEALQILGPDRDNKRFAALICAIPPIQFLDRLLRDAWATLGGDIEAAERYTDLLMAVCATQEQPSRQVNTLVKQIFAKPILPAKPGCQPTPAEDPCAGKKQPAAPCDCQETIIDPDDVKVLVMAALHAACGNRKKARRFVRTVLDQVARFDFLASLHRAAVKLLCGDQAGAGQFIDLLELFLYPGKDQACECRCGGLSCHHCWDNELVDCLKAIVGQWQCIACFRVTAVVPARACPGDIVLIKGYGFGQKAGQVAFRQQGGLNYGSPLDVVSWCDTQIEVRVPEEAGCGLKPILPADTIKICGRMLEYRPLGCLEADFEGTAAEILQFTVKGIKEGECLQPGAVLPIRWKTCATDNVRVEILDLESGTVMAALDPAPERGRWDYADTNVTRTTRIGVRIVVNGQCKPAQSTQQREFIIQRTPNLTIQGLEITQAIQHYRAAAHLDDPADRGPNNSLRLVTNKSAWVRTYLRSGQIAGFDNGQVQAVTGTLTVERRVNGVWGVVANIAPQNGPIDAEDSFVSLDAERGNINNTLNFIVPAATMTGLLRFTVNVASAMAACPGNSADYATTVDVNLEQTLNAAFITIGYEGRNATNTGNLDLPAPTLADCFDETTWALTTYPVSSVPNVRIAGTFDTFTPLDDPRSCPGCCSPNWGPLLTQVAGLVLLDQIANPGTDWAYYGIINNGIPVNVPGCNWAATGGLAGRQETYAHEIGHQFGLPHARCGNAGAGNANYPIYEPYDLPVDVPANPINTTNWTMASIGEYGLDINNGNIANPNTAEDFMSYCSPRWISVFTHNYLINRPEFSPTVIATGSGAAASRVIRDEVNDFVRRGDEIEPLIHLIGMLSDDEVEIEKVARLASPYRPGQGRATNLIAQLLGEEDEILAQDIVYAYSDEGCGTAGSGDCGCSDAGCEEKRSQLLRAMLKDAAPGQCLRIVKDGKTIWERRCPAKAPRLSNIRCNYVRDGSIQLSWRCQTAGDGQEECWLRYSQDGKQWQALTVGVTNNGFKIDPDRLPSGEIRFQILAHDGFFTTIAESKPITVAHREPTATILYPTDRALAYAEQQLHLWGAGLGSAGQRLADDAFVWTINDKEVGRGPDIWVSNPGEGEWLVRLTVADGNLTATRETIVTIQSA